MSASALPDATRVAVIGAGAMGAGIAQVAARAGHEVLLFDARAGAAEAGRARLVNDFEGLAAKGRMEPEAAAQAGARVGAAERLEDLAGAGLFVEAIVEDLAAKRALFAALEEIAAPDAILATNTSSLSISAIAAGAKRPERIAGLHFFNPAPIMALVEVVSGLATDPAIASRLMATARAWGKVPVAARSTPGFIVNRVARPFYAEALRLLEEGAADPATLDAVMREAGGFKMGPFALMDLIGHDVNYAVTNSVFDAFFGDPRFRPSLVQGELVAAGWLGRKAKRGFYDYGGDAQMPAPATLPAAPAPAQVRIEGDLKAAAGLVAACEAAGLPVTHTEGPGLIRIPGACLALTDGRSATTRAAADGLTDLVLFDLARDYGAASRIAVARADQAGPQALAAAAGLFQALGKQASVLDDVPGLLLMRTLAMLANEAAEAVLTGVASAADIDQAMVAGVAYPQGPLAWADAVGPATLLGVLDAIAGETGDDRYRASRLLRRRVAAGAPLAG